METHRDRDRETETDRQTDREVVKYSCTLVENVTALVDRVTTVTFCGTPKGKNSNNNNNKTSRFSDSAE